MDRMCRFIAAASGWGAQVRACEEGPKCLAQSFPAETLLPNINSSEKEISLKDCLPLITAFNRSLANAVQHALKQGCFPIVIGGDHSVAVGTWTGVQHFFNAPLGLIWIDAHMDSHSQETTPSGAWHGMPLAALLGYEKALSEETILRPENICLIGIRSYEEGEAALLERLHVKVYFQDEVKKRGFSEVLKEAIAHVSKHTQGYGVSLDVDVVDPSEAPGVGSPERDGLHARDLLQGLDLIATDPRLRAFELVELNPQRDVEGKTLRLCEQILTKIASYHDATGGSEQRIASGFP